MADHFSIEKWRFALANPMPTFSATEDSLDRSGSSTKISIGFGDTMLASYSGWFDIIYTRDGSEPDCWPRTDGSCDISRVSTITPPMGWRYDYTINLSNAVASNTIKARFVTEACPDIEDTPVVEREFD